MPIFKFFRKKNPQIISVAKMTLDRKSWSDVWRMISRINFRKLAWDVYNLSTPPSTEAKNSTFKLSCLHAIKRRQQWLHQAARHLGHESWLTPRDLFRIEIWMQKKVLLWAVVWSGHADSNSQGEGSTSNRCYFSSLANIKMPYLGQLTRINMYALNKGFLLFSFSVSLQSSQFCDFTQIFPKL